MEYQREGSEVRVLFPALRKEYTSDSQPSCHSRESSLLAAVGLCTHMRVRSSQVHIYTLCVHVRGFQDRVSQSLAVLELTL